MRRTTLITLATMATAAPALSVQTARHVAPRESRGTVDSAWAAQLERDRQAAFVRNDITALDHTTAADYTTINSSGRISNKVQMMTRLRSGTTKVVSNSLDSLKARVYGQAAVITGRLREISETGGQRKDEQYLFTRVFVKMDGRWVAVAYQQTKPDR
jgi:uncharacterized protein YchJ